MRGALWLSAWGAVADGWGAVTEWVGWVGRSVYSRI